MVNTAVIIPGVATVHQRQDWQDDEWPVTGLPSTGLWEDFVGHYPGAGDVPDNDYRGHVYTDPRRFQGDLFGYYRQMQQSYAKPKADGGRGYSVGYNFGIDYLGGLTVLRGFDFRNAANAGSKLPGNWNSRSLSAQFVTDLTQPATDQALYTFAMLVAFLRHHGHTANIKRHDDGEYTSCPGAVGAQLSAGFGNPAYWQHVGPPTGCAPLPWYLQTTPTSPIEEGPDMSRIRYRDDSYAPEAYTGLVSNGPLLGWIADGDGDIALGKCGARIVDDLSAAELDGLIKTSQTTSECPPEWVGTYREALWDARRG